MVSITCTNCKASLTIDDAFVGGVCRCQYCGTIQTVPRNRPSAPQAIPAHAPKTLYSNQARTRSAAPASGTGLDELADAVASSSGISGSGLAGQGTGGNTAPGEQALPEAQPRPSRMMLPMLLVGSAIAIVLLGILVAILLSRGSGSNSASAVSSTGSPDVILGPSFCGIPVNGGSVIFILDRGNSIGELFDTLKATCYKTLKQLGPDRKFQVILWDNEAGSAEFPAGTMRNATAGAIEDCQRDFQDLTASGSSHLSGPIREALSRHPQMIVIATGKSDLDDDDTAALKGAGSAGIRVDAVQIAAAPNAVLEQVCKATGGQLKVVSSAELKDFSR